MSPVYSVFKDVKLFKFLHIFIVHHFPSWFYNELDCNKLPVNSGHPSSINSNLRAIFCILSSTLSGTFRYCTCKSQGLFHRDTKVCLRRNIIKTKASCYFTLMELGASWVVPLQYNKGSGLNQS